MSGLPQIHPKDIPGARWWKFDFHTHTPASYDFLPRSGGTITEDLAETWLRTAMAAGLEAVAITDHNTSEGIPYIQAAAARLKDRGESPPTVFPGVEVTADNGCHVLFIADPACKKEDIDHLLSKAGLEPSIRGSHDARSKLNLEELLGCASEKWLVIPAHVNGPKGVLALEGEQRLQVLGHAKLLAVEIDPSVPDQGDGNLDKWLNGAASINGLRRLTRVYGSDAHGLDQLGRRFTWVKLSSECGRLTIDGLRLALLDGTDSVQVGTNDPVQQSPNSRIPKSMISGVTIQNAKYVGRENPFEISFSPWFTAIIGPRGTGKSTIVDMLRLALKSDSVDNRDHESLDSTEGTDRKPLDLEFQRRMSAESPFGLLTGDTRLQVAVTSGGMPFRVEWNANERRPLAAMQQTDNSYLAQPERRISSDLSTQIFGQKELFEKSRVPSSLLQEVDSQPEVARHGFDQKIARLKGEFLDLSAELRRLQAEVDDLASELPRLDEVRQKLAAMESAEIRESLRSNRDIGAFEASIQRRIRLLCQSADEIGALADRLDGRVLPDFPALDGVEPGLRESGERLGMGLQAHIDGFQSGLRELAEKLQKSMAELPGTPEARQWAEHVRAAQSRFEEATKALQKAGVSDPREYGVLVGRQRELEDRVSRRSELAGIVRELEARKNTALLNYRRCIHERAQARSGVLKLSSEDTKSAGLRVEVTLRPQADYEGLRTFVRLKFSVREDTYQNDIESLASRICTEEGQSQSDSWESRLDKCVDELLLLGSGSLSVTSTYTKKFRERIAGLQSQVFDELRLYAPGDKIDLKFARDGSKLQSLDSGSPGQRTAALLALILQLGDAPLVIDQPEDDLDNALIYSLVVSGIRKCRGRRQVIFVTHNPNIVVHGDADLVVSLDTKNGRTVFSPDPPNGLSIPGVRDRVCTVLEGGRRAFEERFRRIVGGLEVPSGNAK